MYTCINIKYVNGDIGETTKRIGHASTETTKRVYIRKPTTVSPLKRKS